jgi:SagB-type dehydrogenase family enzyme
MQNRKGAEIPGIMSGSDSRVGLLKKSTLERLTKGNTAGAPSDRTFPSMTAEHPSILLPKPSETGRLTVEEAIARRRSTRDYLERPVTLRQLSQLLWAAQGITDVGNGLRSAPSAGALYPLELHVVVRERGVEGLTAGIYKYVVGNRSVTKVSDGDYLQRLKIAALDQDPVGSCAACVVISAVFGRTTSKYNQRGRQYVIQEAGHAAENVCLQATALDLGTVVIGAFVEGDVSRLVGLRADETPVCLLPIGVPAP